MMVLPEGRATPKPRRHAHFRNTLIRAPAAENATSTHQRRMRRAATMSWWSQNVRALDEGHASGDTIMTIREGLYRPFCTGNVWTSICPLCSSQLNAGTSACVCSKKAKKQLKFKSKLARARQKVVRLKTEIQGAC